MKIKEWVKKNVIEHINPTFITIMLLVISLTHNTVLEKRINHLNKEVATNTNNIEAYEGLLNNAYSQNNVLRLNVESLSYSKDSLLNKLDSVKNELKISDKAIRTAAIQQSKVNIVEKDTVLINDNCEFKKEFKPNELTIVKIELKQDSLQCEIKINNDQYLYIYGKKDWKNKNKKFFKRLFTWDWKKIVYYRYNIVNTNPLVQVGNTRIIENIENK